MSTAFNLPPYISGSFSNLIHKNPNVPQIPSLSKATSRPINSNFSQSLSNVESLIPGFGNLNLHPKGFNHSLEASFGKNNFGDETFGNEKTQESPFPDKSYISAHFNDPKYEPVPGTSSLESTEIDLPSNLPFNGKSNPVGLFTNLGSSLFYNSGSNLMSTSFNDPEEEESEEGNDTNPDLLPNSKLPSSGFSVQVPLQTNDQKKKPSNFDIPPPPSMSSSLASYIQNLPKSNFPLLRNTPGLTELEESVLKIQNSRSVCKPVQVVQKQSSVSNILQNQHRSNKFHSTRNYRLNYDLDYVPFSGSCDNLSTPRTGVYHSKTEISASTMESRQFRNLGQDVGNKEAKKSSNVPPLPVINPTNYKNPSLEVASTSNEKPKVKFSDTVTHILVPGSVRFFVEDCKSLILR